MTARVAASLFSGLKPPPRLRPSVFAERTLVLPASSNAESGPLRLTNYQKGLIDAISEPGVEIIVFKLASQTGKSISIDAILADAILNNPGPILHVSPTDAKALAYVRDRLDPLIFASPSLKAIVGEGPKGVDSRSAKTFPGGSFNIASSYKADDLAARAIRLLLCDEVDRFAQSAGTEGDPVTLAIKRTRTFRNRKIVLASTPTLKQTSRIEAWYQRGDQRKFHVACVECGAVAAVTPSRLIFDAGKPETARFACDDCGHHASEAERLAMVDAGEWVATAKGEPSIISFHANELISKFSSLESVARQVDAAQTFEQKRVLTNTVWAEPYEATTETELFASDLQARAVHIEAPYPKAIAFVTAGIDVQSNRVEMTTLAHASNGERYVLDHIVIPGDTSGEAIWADLDAQLASTFLTADNRRLPLSAVAIDSGFETTRVATFVNAQRRKQRRVFAIKGTAGFDKPNVRQGSKIKGLTHVYLIGVDGVKLALQKALGLEAGAPFYIHLPAHLPDGYFEQLSAERLTAKFVRGYPVYRFEKDAHTRNEALDCLTYASAIASLVKKPSEPVNKPAVQKLSIAERAARLNAMSNGGAPQQMGTSYYGEIAC